MCDIQGLERKWRVSVCPRYRLATAAYVSAVLPLRLFEFVLRVVVSGSGTWYLRVQLSADGRARRRTSDVSKTWQEHTFDLFPHRNKVRLLRSSEERSIRTRSRIHSLSEDQQRTRARPRLNQPVSDALACFGG